jgi:hypothetical protein
MLKNTISAICFRQVVSSGLAGVCLIHVSSGVVVDLVSDLLNEVSTQSTYRRVCFEWHRAYRQEDQEVKIVALKLPWGVLHALFHNTVLYGEPYYEKSCALDTVRRLLEPMTKGKVLNV